MDFLTGLQIAFKAICGRLLLMENLFSCHTSHCYKRCMVESINTGSTKSDIVFKLFVDLKKKVSLEKSDKGWKIHKAREVVNRTSSHCNLTICSVEIVIIIL